MEEYRLTQFSPGAGCGCKISPMDLEKILKSEIEKIYFPDLLVGNETKDDAAVYKIDDETAIISTTDFFTPIVDDPFDFGRIAATNAISDIYAMGGKPILAIAILGWPLDKLPAEVAQKVIDGARFVCNNAGIPIAGGHSIDISDPVFGLAVNGIIHPNKVKRNDSAKAGSLLFLTKPLGIGIITTAEKRNIVKPEHKKLAVDLMSELNKAGSVFAELDGISAMTDVTGFGLLGHLLEICMGSNLVAKINLDKVPIINGIKQYIDAKAIPGGTYRNFKSYGQYINWKDENDKFILCDPQTSGGLLIAVEENAVENFLYTAKSIGLNIEPFGKLYNKSSDKTYYINFE
ncbi:MAG: selenide, water dikinase [Marinilabiliales bacterium]